MNRPVIFTVPAGWGDEASVWTGHCDEIPAAADAPTLDELFQRISAMAKSGTARSRSGISQCR